MRNKAAISESRPGSVGVYDFVKVPHAIDLNFPWRSRTYARSKNNSRFVMVSTTRFFLGVPVHELRPYPISVSAGGSQRLT
jgi:hypothetical protein